MDMATISGATGAAWLADKAAKSVGVDLTKIAKDTVDGVVDTVGAVLRLPANINIGRIINTIV
jgi:hypothetical protein